MSYYLLEILLDHRRSLQYFHIILKTLEFSKQSYFG